MNPQIFREYDIRGVVGRDFDEADVERKRETFSDKGLKAEEMVTLGYDVVEVTDYGLPARAMYNEIDRVQEFLQRVKQAINRANKTELAELS